MASIGSNSNAAADAGTDVASTRADVVVALTSYNDERTVAAVARAARDGLARHFGSRETLIVLADARSTDGTREAARAAAGSDRFIELDPQPAAALLELPYHGHPDRGRTIRAIFQTAARVGAQACAVLDAGIENVSEDWIERLIAPVLDEGCDYVSPHYLRRVSDGAITKAIVYPLFRALYGVRLRQPAAGEFGCAARLVTYYLAQDFWDAEHAEVGIDLWLAVAAVCGGYRTCEASLGPRVTSHDSPAIDLSTTLAQVVGALFADLDQRVEFWQRTRGSVAIPVVGAPPPSAELDPVSISIDGLIESFRLGYQELREIWTYVLPPRTIVELRRLTAATPDRFQLDDRLWASIVYDFAIGYSFRVMPHDHLLRSLTPLYTGWLASFLAEAGSSTLDRAEQRLEQLCLAFEAEKRHLISRWRWPERLR